MQTAEKVQSLIAQGARIPCPASVYIEEAVELDRISPNVTIFPGCRIMGAATSIGPGCSLGAEGPVTVADCQLAENVRLAGGSFAGTVMLDGCKFGPCAHVREFTLLEENSSCAHSVGLKHTVLQPYVTLGSLINFCDCMMAGGTDARNHSEVGSSYIHFNYTPHQDKATPSLLGDVPRGVMLDQRPIFLGGQGGLVGPCRLEFGTIVAAGTVCRKDVAEPGRLIFETVSRSSGNTSYQHEIYGDITRIIANNFIYLGNLHALYHWYRQVRVRFLKDAFGRACHEGALCGLSEMLKERLKRISDLARNVEKSLAAVRASQGTLPDYPFGMQARFASKWPALQARLDFSCTENAGKEFQVQFLNQMQTAGAGSYLNMIKALAPAAKQPGTAWLQAVVDAVAALREELAD